MSAIPEDLDDVLAPDKPPENDVVKDSEERWRIENDAGASWALRKLAKIRQRQTDNDALADVEIQRIQAWLAKANESSQHEAEFFESLLEQYHRGVLHEDERRKTIELPSGTLKARKLPDRVEVEDEKFMPWAEVARPELVRVKKEPNVAALKKLLVPDAPDGKAVDSETGEIVPGCVIERGEVRYTQSTERNER